MVSLKANLSRNATPSWSGYIHQGKVGFLVALREIKESIIKKEKNYLNFAIRYENAEDFDIVDDKGNVISRNQVKAYIAGDEREDYSEIFKIQKRGFNKQKEIITKKGFQIHSFDGRGNIIKVEVPPNKRFLHVVCAVKDFNLSRQQYRNKYKNRDKYTPNNSRVKLYIYDRKNKITFCPISEETNDKIKEYCKKEIEEILALNSNVLKDDDVHLERVYLYYVGALLDASIGKAHKNKLYPEIYFSDILNLIQTVIKEDPVIKMKNTLIYSWEKYHSENEKNVNKSVFDSMDCVIKEIIGLSKEEFVKVVRMLLPQESEGADFTLLFTTTLLENIFYELLQKVQKYPFETYSYKDNSNKSYRISLIDINNNSAKISTLVEKLIRNKEFIKATFDRDFLINRTINGTILDDPIIGMEDITKDKNNIFKPNMSFISVDKAITEIVNVWEG